MTAPRRTDAQRAYLDRPADEHSLSHEQIAKNGLSEPSDFMAFPDSGYAANHEWDLGGDVKKTQAELRRARTRFPKPLQGGSLLAVAAPLTSSQARKAARNGGAATITKRSDAKRAMTSWEPGDQLPERKLCTCPASGRG